MLGLSIFVGLAVAALLTGWFWTYSYTSITDTLNAPPSLSHPSDAGRPQPMPTTRSTRMAASNHDSGERNASATD